MNELNYMRNGLKQIFDKPQAPYLRHTVVEDPSPIIVPRTYVQKDDFQGKCQPPSLYYCWSYANVESHCESEMKQRWDVM